ncbi:hypothetical protein M885DRAFT_465557, partial [Pelagophyceae sp. CCMP2097]
MAHAFKEDMPAITPAEEAQLRRVYDLLCDFGAKQVLLKELRPKKDRAALLRLRADDDHAAAAESGAELALLDVDVYDLRTKVTRLEAQSHGVITAADLTEALRTLGKRVPHKFVEDLIWEVDENLDGCVDWDELRLMFQRNIRDRSGLEPSQLFNVVQFLIFDQDENGLVSVDETMNMLYARYGRVRMEAKLKELFGNDMRETGTQGGEIDFSAYLRAVEKTQLVTFLNSAAGKVQVAKAG